MHVPWCYDRSSPDGQTWLSANIHRYLGVAPPMAGSSSVFEHLIGGSALLASAGIQRPTLRAIARSLEPVLAALSPHPQFYSNVRTPSPLEVLDEYYNPV